jgi:hypothetical protein
VGSVEEEECSLLACCRGQKLISRFDKKTIVEDLWTIDTWLYIAVGWECRLLDQPAYPLTFFAVSLPAQVYNINQPLNSYKSGKVGYYALAGLWITKRRAQ